MVKENILGFQISVASTDDSIAQITSWIAAKEKAKYFVCANPHSLEITRIDPFFDQAIRNADLITPDGIGIILASKILNGRILERITGSDIFFGLSKTLNQERRHRYFFLGSTEDVLDGIQQRMRKDYPNITVVGTYAPPFKHEFSENEHSQMIEAVNRTKPDVLWVGMTAPKQEKWIYQNREKLNVKFIGAIGAVFDFYAGTVKRSHPWFQRHGLEWLPRLLQEPRRLWRRNFISNPKFLMRVLKEYISRRYAKG